MYSSIELFRIGFLSITVVDLIDIAIVGVIVYRLYSILQGTIAARIFLGLVVIAAVSVVSQTLGMKLLSWILRTVGDVWVIALIILFQPELRRILLTIGRKGVFTTFRQYDIRTVIDEVLDAVQELSLRAYGALIVFRRGSDISMIVDTGVPIEARATREMLLSIFNPKSPLHDGAVVISGEQIQSARVILPLSERMPNAELGTRHRAALGISQQSDVFVIVVSEESGRVSYALDGTLHLNEDADSVRIALLTMLSAGQKEKIKPSRMAWLLRSASLRQWRRSMKMRSSKSAKIDDDIE